MAFGSTSRVQIQYLVESRTLSCLDINASTTWPCFFSDLAETKPHMRD